MNLKTTIIDVTPDKFADYPQIICYINPKHKFYHLKIDWLKARYKEGLKTKLLFLEGEKKPVGFIEYVPGHYCWRAVDAKGYMFIHCLWTYGKKHQHKGLGRLLIEEVEKEAKAMLGVAVVTSDKSFMANKDIFVKNGYTIAAESGKDQLLYKPFKNGSVPSINNWQDRLAKIDGLTIVYSKQCPWVARFVEEIEPILKKEKIVIKTIELKTAAQAQKAPSLYGVFNLIHNGTLLVDRYISITRFWNIMKKEFPKKTVKRKK
ncbi:MAG: GNAT family N-acetyltransferase [Sedimentisphaerales bacterium]|nr:GNAT family N-acetyltransferase [Sedimentisphaerales bacterium]